MRPGLGRSRGKLQATRGAPPGLNDLGPRLMHKKTPKSWAGHIQRQVSWKVETCRVKVEAHRPPGPRVRAGVRELLSSLGGARTPDGSSIGSPLALDMVLTISSAFLSFSYRWKLLVSP